MSWWRSRRSRSVSANSSSITRNATWNARKPRKPPRPSRLRRAQERRRGASGGAARPPAFVVPVNHVRWDRRASGLWQPTLAAGPPRRRPLVVPFTQSGQHRGQRRLERLQGDRFAEDLVGEEISFGEIVRGAGQKD